VPAPGVAPPEPAVWSSRALVQAVRNANEATSKTQRLELAFIDSKLPRDRDATSASAHGRATAVLTDTRARPKQELTELPMPSANTVGAIVWSAHLA
jgi:hypothetical protein